MRRRRSLRHRYGHKRLSYGERQGIPTHEFALESRRQLPLIDARHVRAAAARLSMMHHMRHVTPAEYRHAMARIRAAEKRYGIR